MSRSARARWALSFADLCLLLLGFFVLLQANQATREEALAGLNNYFGAIEAPARIDMSAKSLFSQGEALLSPEGKAQLSRAAKPLFSRKSAIRLQSIGLASGEHRFDAWDLSAARLGAVARALVAAGIAPDRIRIAGLAEQDGPASQGQVIRIVEVPIASE